MGSAFRSASNSTAMGPHHLLFCPETRQDFETVVKIERFQRGFPGTRKLAGSVRYAGSWYVQPWQSAPPQEAIMFLEQVTGRQIAV